MDHILGLCSWLLRQGEMDGGLISFAEPPRNFFTPFQKQFCCYHLSVKRGKHESDELS
jgi:hypothetical protein